MLPPVETQYSLSELAASVQGWCDEHQVQPANGQAAEAISERTIRYYRTIGLLDAPVGGYVKSFTERHRLQLLAIRIHQAQGLPLRLIRERLYGRSEADLRKLTRPESFRRPLPLQDSVAREDAPQQWTAVALGDDFLVVSRRGRALRPEFLGRLREVIQSEFPSFTTRNPD